VIVAAPSPPPRDRARLHRRGIHILVEKPIASSVEEGRTSSPLAAAPA